jgi:hypothetical protein
MQAGGKLDHFVFLMASCGKMNCVWILSVLLLTIVCEVEPKNRKLPPQSFVVIPQIGESFVSNKGKLMTSSVRTNYTDFVKGKVFRFFLSDKEKSAIIPPQRFEHLIGHEFNEQLTLVVSHYTPVTWGDVLFILSGYPTLGFFPDIDNLPSKRIKVIIDVRDDGHWIHDFEPFSIGVDKNHQIMIYKNNFKPLDYEKLYKQLDSQVTTIVPVRSFFQFFFAHTAFFFSFFGQDENNC